MYSGNKQTKIAKLKIIYCLFDLGFALSNHYSLLHANQTAVGTELGLGGFGFR
jgi:hypothetical protein